MLFPIMVHREKKKAVDQGEEEEEEEGGQDTIHITRYGRTEAAIL